MGKILALVTGCWLLVVGCSTTEKPTDQQISDHQKDVHTWFTKRVDELKSHDGWLNLAGLYWLNEGMNSFGSDADNDVVFPSGKIAAKAGYFLVKGQHVTIIPSPGVDLKEAVVFHPDSAKAIKLLQGSTMTYGSLEWYVIRRDDKMGIRLRDLESDGVKNFTGIERYPVDYAWKVKAKFVTPAPGTKINITNVLGQTTAEDLTGVYVFEIEGKEYKLNATGKGEKLFAVFADATNGKGTYPAGKFVYIDRPDSTGTVFIDFNKSYNPPCAFTEFATCPLPPPENKLTVSILAGEKNYELHGKQTSSTL